jgi:hypothetical protein
LSDAGKIPAMRQARLPRKRSPVLISKKRGDRRSCIFWQPGS